MDYIAEIPGAVELRDQFGGFPSFADAPAELQIHGNGTGFLKVSSYFLGPAGNYDRARPFVATFWFDGLQEVLLNGFNDKMYIDELRVGRNGSHFVVEWQAAYGVQGAIRSRGLRITREP